MYKYYGFEIDADNFSVVQSEVGFGVIREVPPPDTCLLAKHFSVHPETFLTPASGVCLPFDCGPFRAHEPLVSVEWIREERKPLPNEPECNAYRFLFGRARDGRYMGYDATEMQSSPLTGQVSDHWMDLDTTIQRFGGMVDL